LKKLQLSRLRDIKFRGDRVSWAESRHAGTSWIHPTSTCHLTPQRYCYVTRNNSNLLPLHAPV